MRLLIAATLAFFLSTFPDLKTCLAREIVYGFDRDFPPYTYTQDGKATGFEVEILEAIFRGRNAEIKPRPMKWENVQDELTSGKIQVTSGMAVTEERREYFDFADIPVTSLDVMLFIKDREHIRSINDLKGKQVSTQSGSLYHRTLEKIDGIKLVLYDTESDALTALWKDEVSAFGGARMTAHFHMKKLGYSGIWGLGTPVRIVRTYFVTRKGDSELLRSLNQGIRSIMIDGTYDKIYRKWFVDELTAEEINFLVSSAQEASARFYAPYSGFREGAAVLTRSGRIYTGCNIENAVPAFSSTAVKVAVFRAIAEGDGEIKAVARTRPDGAAGAPSIDDRQIVFEFGRGILIVLEHDRNRREAVMVSSLLPYHFDPEWDAFKPDHQILD